MWQRLALYCCSMIVAIYGWIFASVHRNGNNELTACNEYKHYFKIKLNAIQTSQKPHKGRFSRNKSHFAMAKEQRVMGKLREMSIQHIYIVKSEIH